MLCIGFFRTFLSFSSTFPTKCCWRYLFFFFFFCCWLHCQTFNLKFSSFTSSSTCRWDGVHRHPKKLITKCIHFVLQLRTSWLLVRGFDFFFSPWHWWKTIGLNWSSKGNDFNQKNWEHNILIVWASLSKKMQTQRYWQQSSSRL